jgi:hypothetical protein
MDTWTPLFSSIVTSTVWGEAPHVKIVWITILALKDKAGFVAGSVPGLARVAVVTTEQCREALAVLEGADEDSKNREHEGRRIKSVEGGWVVLGHERFQKLMREVSTKVGNAKRQAQYRARHKGVGTVRERAYVKAVNEGNEARAERIADPDYLKGV